MQKFRIITFFIVLTLASSCAVGKDRSALLNDSLGIENYVLLNFEDYNGLITEKNADSSAELTEDDFAVLKSITIEFLKQENRLAETEIHKIENTDKPESYLFQILPIMDAQKHKLVWINGIHKSLLDKGQDLKKLIVIADGPNVNFNFWIDLSDKKIVK